MTDKADKLLPSPSWWRAEMTFAEFLQQLKLFNDVEYTRDEIEFTHDLYVGDVLLGEAAQVEEPGPGMRIGFYSLFGHDPRYGVLNSKLELLPKPDAH